MPQHRGDRRQGSRLRQVAVASSEHILSTLVQTTLPSGALTGRNNQHALATHCVESVQIEARKPPIGILSKSLLGPKGRT